MPDKRGLPCLDWDYCNACNGVGHDENACFWCETCMGAGTVIAKRYCYEVVSEPMTTYYDGYAPPETGCEWGVFMARNQREAKILAVRSPDFSESVREARGDGVPPMARLTGRLARCEHGVCWGCKSTEESSGCADCDDDLEDREAAEATEYNQRMAEA